MQDVQLIDFFNFSPGDKPAQGLFLNFDKQLFAFGFGQFLGVIEPENGPGRVKNNCSGHHCAAQRAAADFVNARDQVLDKGEIQTCLHGWRTHSESGGPSRLNTASAA
ncbi:hypothetical protein ALP64_202378 [Pseudomonas syringae pv. actinidiae]|nr:hypothetical protein ALP64_202378 [Pseudomonas syringae pv. actinidiae]